MTILKRYKQLNNCEVKSVRSEIIRVAMTSNEKYDFHGFSASEKAQIKKSLEGSAPTKTKKKDEEKLWKKETCRH